MTGHRLARLARLSAAADRRWVCRARLEHLDGQLLVAARLAERTPALWHVRLTALGWGCAFPAAATSALPVG
jgi:hypothetical protein